MKKPNNRRNLDIAIHRVSESEEGFVQYRTTMANTVVGQMLPSGVLKGGASLKIRYGATATRFTTDLDTARAEDLDSFINRLGEELAEGWEGFTGRVLPRNPAHPDGVPPAYVMQPFDIKLEYFGRPWCTVALEVGYNEIGDADEAEWYIAPDIIKMFTDLGFPEPSPLPLMPLHYQIAQKLHGLSEEGSERPHDLVDLQLMMKDESLNIQIIDDTCKRLFAYRKLQKWPCTITKNERWGQLYDEARAGLDVVENIDDAIQWANDFVNHIDSCS